MAQHGFCLDEPEPDVGGHDPVLEGVAAEEVLGRRSSSGQGHVDLAIFDRKNLGELRFADDLN